MTKLEFKIVEIPEGHSSRVVALEDEYFALDPHVFKGGEISLSFNKTIHFIQVQFSLDIDVELVCDRSLESFIYPIEADYQVIFKVDVGEETENDEGAIRNFNFSGNTLSIEEEVRDTILLNVPVKKLHPRFLDEEGKPKDFVAESFGATGEGEDNSDIDPRWEALKKLKTN